VIHPTLDKTRFAYILMYPTLSSLLMNTPRSDLKPLSSTSEAPADAVVIEAGSSRDFSVYEGARFLVQLFGKDGEVLDEVTLLIRDPFVELSEATAVSPTGTGQLVRDDRCWTGGPPCQLHSQG